jgi:hypothetical protein
MSEWYPSTSAPTSMTTVCPSSMTVDPGRWCGREAPVGPVATMVS